MDSLNASLLANAAAMTAVVTLLVSLMAPFVESIPAFADTPENKARHDAALRLLNVLLNVGSVALFALASGGVSASDLLPLFVQALAQSAGAHFAYHVVTQGPVGAIPAPASPATVAVSAATSVPDYPVGVPSVAALGLPLADAAGLSDSSAPAPSTTPA